MTHSIGGIIAIPKKNPKKDKENEVDIDQLAGLITVPSYTTTTSHTHTLQPNYNSNYQWTPAPTPLPHFSLGTEEENQELLAMMECLGVEPTDNYLSGILIIIGEKYYSFTELLCKQMQFMNRLNILLCHRGSDDEN